MNNIPRYEIKDPTGVNRKSTEINAPPPAEVRIGQLEVKIEGLKEKLDSERNLKFWVVATVITIATGIVGGISFYYTMTQNYLDSISDTEQRYYQELIKVHSVSIKIESCSSSSEYYWQFKNCLYKQ